MSAHRGWGAGPQSLRAEPPESTQSRREGPGHGKCHLISQISFSLMDKSERNPPAGEGAFHTHPEGEAAAKH